MKHRLPTSVSVALLTTAIALALATPALAWDRWSVADDATNCRSCHGDFRAADYVSPTDGQSWGNLHNLHRSTMLSGDCDACHGNDTFPVLLASSSGGDGLEPLGCMGCHGRAEDNGASNPESPHGYGAGLRQHHFNAGVTMCAGCHQDADPIDYSPVGEDVLPPYYADPGNNHPNIPTDPCNADGSEDFAGAAQGQDNDGDLAYDGDDTDCSGTATPETPGATLEVSNYPNPFNPRTTISFAVDTAGPVRLAIYSVAGDLVRVLYEGTVAAGRHALEWDGTDLAGRPATSGLYLCQLQTDRTSLTRTMTLVR